MRKLPKKILLWLALLGTVIFMLYIVIASFDRPFFIVFWPPDPNEQTAIKDIIYKSEHLEGLAARNFDTSQFDTVFINDPAVKLNSVAVNNQAQWLKHDPSLPLISGMLNFKRAWYDYWNYTWSSYEQLQNKQGGQTPTAAQIYTITGDYTLPPAPRSDPMYDLPIDFQSFSISGNHAEVVFATGGVKMRYYLVKTKDGWRIAGAETLQIYG